MSLRHLVPLLCCVAILGGVTRHAWCDEPNAAADLAYESSVRPLFKAYCFHCHGDDGQREGNLDLRLARLAIAGGDSGPAIVPGKSAESKLWQRLRAGEMPPGEKKLTPAQLETIARWIDAGAKTARPEPAQLADDGLTEDERAHWAFQPIRRPPLPPTTLNSRRSPIAPSDDSTDRFARSPIDLFVLERLAPLDLQFSPLADRETLLRRLTFDLLGLPPTTDERDDFLAHEGPDAVERLVDRLLTSPRHGERWGRHWLDVAGYADSDGYTEKDPERKYAYKYRDYVLRAFNADRPWNELIVEQLAGDELLTPPYRDLTAEQAEKLIATGFLRMGPDGTGESVADPNLARNEVVAETIKIVSSSLLGLTVGCAQCHSHKYDPISQVDYYRFRALFEPAYNWKAWRNPNTRLVSLLTEETKSRMAAVDARVKELEKQRADEYQALIEVVREEELLQVPEEEREAARAAAKEAPAKRTDEQKALITKYPKIDVKLGLVDRVKPKEHKAITEKYAKLIDEAKQSRPAEDFAHCLTEVPGQIPVTQLFFRGEYKQPKQEVSPAELTALRLGREVAIPPDDPQIPTSGRRLAYARQLVSGQHPLVARVLVNRLWLHHFGRGIVATPSDFGALGQRPTHPELLDWLADEFQRGGAPGTGTAWTTKRLHRLLTTSTAYRQSSRRTETLDRIDPENKWLARMTARRLEAEAIRDSLLAVSGRLENQLYGPPAPVAPDEAGQVVVAVDTRDTAGRPTGKHVPLFGQEFRRGVYVQTRRTLPLGLLEAFDGPTLAPNCELRAQTTVAPQSLLMLNSDFVLKQAEGLAERLEREASADPVARVELLWRIALGTTPTPTQRAAALEFLQNIVGDFPTNAPPADPKQAAVQPDPNRLALVGLCQAVLASNAFLYVD